MCPSAGDEACRLAGRLASCFEISERSEASVERFQAASRRLQVPSDSRILGESSASGYVMGSAAPRGFRWGATGWSSRTDGGLRRGGGRGWYTMPTERPGAAGNYHDVGARGRTRHVERGGCWLCDWHGMRWSNRERGLLRSPTEG